MEKKIIKIEVKDEFFAKIKPAYYLKDDFWHYINICRQVGARYNSDGKYQELEYTALSNLIELLEEADFKVDIDPRVKEKAFNLINSINSREDEIKLELDSINKKLRPSGRQIAPYQMEDIIRMRLVSTDPYKAILNANPMGSGKTMEAILALPKGTPTLVICPAVAKGVWEREIRKWRPDNPSIVVLKGRQNSLEIEADFTIINYDILPPMEYLQRENAIPKNLNLIVDECHTIKNPKAARTAKVRRIANVIEGVVFLLTGTPLLNRPPELWNILTIRDLNKKAFKNWMNFTNLFNGFRDAYGWVWGTPRPEVKHLLERVTIRHKKEDILKELPDKIIEKIVVDYKKSDLSVMPRSEWEELHTTLLDSSAVIDVGQLSKARAALATAKIPAMISMVREFMEANTPLVVVSAYRKPIEELQRQFKCPVILGDTPPEKRNKIEEEFQKHGKLLGMTIKSGGVAITLTKASTMLFVDQEWTPALNEQCMDRIHRIGQKNNCRYIFLQADHPVDELVTDTLLRKYEIINRSVNRVDKYQEKARKNLLRLLERKQEEIKHYEKEAKVKRYRITTNKHKWIWLSIRRLLDKDQDQATFKNGEGFNKMDGVWIRKMIKDYKEKGGWTAKQWDVVFKKLQKYWRQIGRYNPGVFV